MSQFHFIIQKTDLWSSRNSHALITKMVNRAYWQMNKPRWGHYLAVWLGGAVMWAAWPHEVQRVLNKTRKSTETTVCMLLTKPQLLVILEDSVVSLDEKCLFQRLKILMLPKVLPYFHMASVLKESMVRGSRGHGSKLRGCNFLPCRK